MRILRPRLAREVIRIAAEDAFQEEGADEVDEKDLRSHGSFSKYREQWIADRIRLWVDEASLKPGSKI